MSRLSLAVPSKGRLMEQTEARLAKAGLTLRKTGEARGYRGELVEMPEIDVAFVSASEIAAALKAGSIDVGVTGEDLIRETMSDADTRVRFLAPLGFGFADVVVAVPVGWIDVATVADLEDIAQAFRRAHGRWPRVATKYVNIARRFFTDKGYGDYRIVESLGATEGTPAAGTAEMIVDITTTGATLRANGLKILDDGVILKSQANLVASELSPWNDNKHRVCRALTDRLAASSG